MSICFKHSPFTLFELKINSNYYIFNFEIYLFNTNCSRVLFQRVSQRQHPPPRRARGQPPRGHAGRTHAGGVRPQVVSGRPAPGQRRQRQPAQHLAVQRGRDAARPHVLAAPGSGQGEWLDNWTLQSREWLGLSGGGGGMGLGPSTRSRSTWQRSRWAAGQLDTSVQRMIGFKWGRWGDGFGYVHTFLQHLAAVKWAARQLDTSQSRECFLWVLVGGWVWVRPHVLSAPGSGQGERLVYWTLHTVLEMIPLGLSGGGGGMGLGPSTRSLSTWQRSRWAARQLDTSQSREWFLWV